MASRLPVKPLSPCCSVWTGVGSIPRKSRSPSGLHPRADAVRTLRQRLRGLSAWGLQLSGLRILGPTLFVLYVNDCEDCLPGGSSLAVYADDTTLYKCWSSGDSIQNASSNLQQAVDAVAAWGSSWKIQFEPTKSQALTLSNHRPPIALPSIYFNNIPVAEEDEIKLLGVTFDASSPSVPTFGMYPPKPTNAYTSSGM